MVPPEGPNPVRTENQLDAPAAPSAELSIRDVYAMIEVDDPYTHWLDRLQGALEDEHRAHQNLLRQAALGLAAGESPDIRPGQFQPYNQLEWLPDAVPYPVSMANRTGNLITRDVPAHDYLPHQPNVPAVSLTSGDLHAAAEWGAWPVFEDNGSLQQVKPHLRPRWLELIDLVDKVQARKLMNTIRYAKMQRIREVHDQLQSTPNAQTAESLWAAAADRRLDPAALQKFLEAPDNVFERLSYTMLQRLGSRVKPPVDVFTTRVGTDIHYAVDLIARIEQPNRDPAIQLVGIDITGNPNHSIAAGKSSRLRKAMRRGTTLRDPVSQDHQSTVLQVVFMPLTRTIAYTLERWRRQRGNTTATPEFYGLTFQERQQWVSQLYNALVDNQGQPLYSKTDFERAYQSVYGRHDPDNFPFTL